MEENSFTEEIYFKNFIKVPKKLRKALKEEDENYEIKIEEKDLWIVRFNEKQIVTMNRKEKLGFELKGEKDRVQLILRLCVNCFSDKIEKISSEIVENNNSNKSKKETLEFSDEKIIKQIVEISKKKNVEVLLIVRDDLDQLGIKINPQNLQITWIYLSNLDDYLTIDNKEDTITNKTKNIKMVRQICLDFFFCKIKFFFNCF